ncbi:MAG: ABC transporter substrate-binding protein [Nitrososphaera sp.]|jgi:NitT/TauT family transport system substrate-binding protein|uniref:ABC transporter substrate-binding protein n=1 Tax=Candidatus Nitrosocaldus islandicus TaxID=2045011 RepID=UPI000CD26B4A|nr:ABC transporter substrate-binding protein [Candidatus Nitrosocaldus islandicus]
MRYKVIVGIVGSALLIISVLLLLSLSTNSKDDHASTVATRLRIGLQANLTHAPALIAKSSDAFSKELGMDVEYRMFKAGPDTMFALLTGQVDVAYTGPIPAIQAYLASNGSVRVIAGATSGGAKFITREGIDTLEDLRGKRFGTPQYGNTQDIALRSYLLEHGLRLKDDGGDITIINAKNPELLLLFKKGEIDGLWVPEPWASIAVNEGGKIFLDERSIWPDGRFATTVLVARSDLIDRSPDLVHKVLNAHINIIRWINEHRDEAMNITSKEIRSMTGKSLPEDVVKNAFSSLEFTYDPMQGSIEGYIRKGKMVGLFHSDATFDRLFYYDGLNSILEEDKSTLNSFMLVK